MPQQFENPANPEIHRNTTAEEIWNDTDGGVDILVSGIGTGGTITGVARCSRQRSPDCMSSLSSRPIRRCCRAAIPARTRSRASARASRRRFSTPPSMMSRQVSNEEAFEMARRVAKLEGVPVGISSGAALTAAIRVGQRPENAGKNIVVIIPSFAERYLSTALFDGLGG
jgi:cysteine synthase A